MMLQKMLYLEPIQAPQKTIKSNNTNKQINQLFYNPGIRRNLFTRIEEYR